MIGSSFSQTPPPRLNSLLKTLFEPHSVVLQLLHPMKFHKQATQLLLHDLDFRFFFYKCEIRKCTHLETHFSLFSINCYHGEPGAAR